MKKVLFLIAVTLTCITFLNANNFNVSAKSNEGLVTQEVVKYVETIYKDGKVISEKKLKKDEYYKKVKEKKEKRTNNNSDSGIEPYVVDPCPIDGCTNNDTLVVFYDPYPNLVDVFCTSDDYTYCEGNARYDTTYTTHKTKVYLNPNATHGGKIMTTVTFDGVDDNTNALDDYISLSWDGQHLKADASTIKAYQKVYYNYVTQDGTSGSTTKTFNYTKATTPDNVTEVYHGVYVKMNLQDHWNTIYDYKSGEFLWDSNGEILEKVDVTSYTFHLETEFVRSSDSLAVVYKDFGYLKFGADYRHAYYHVNVTSNLNLKVSINNPASYLSFVFTITISYDSKRLNNIEYDFGG